MERATDPAAETCRRDARTGVVTVDGRVFSAVFRDDPKRVNVSGKHGRNTACRICAVNTLLTKKKKKKETLSKRRRRPFVVRGTGGKEKDGLRYGDDRRIAIGNGPVKCSESPFLLRRR